MAYSTNANAEGVLATLEDTGYPTVQRSVRSSGTPAGYADARADLGVLLEILGTPHSDQS